MRTHRVLERGYTWGGQDSRARYNPRNGRLYFPKGEKKDERTEELQKPPAPAGARNYGAHRTHLRYWRRLVETPLRRARKDHDFRLLLLNASERCAAADSRPRARRREVLTPTGPRRRTYSHPHDRFTEGKRSRR